MTKETTDRIKSMKDKVPGFEKKIGETLLEYRQFCQDSGKNSNLTVQQIFARQLRAVRGFGVENCATIARIFKTPFMLRKCFEQCVEGERQIANLMNAGKMELMKNKSAYKD